MILFAWRRLTPPGFIGGAEITEGLIAAALASVGHSVVFVGSSENPRQPSVSSRMWLLYLLKKQGISAVQRRGVLEYRWRGVRCLCVDQSEIDQVTRRLLPLATVLWTSQEGCDEIASLAVGPRVASYVHSITDIGLLSARLGATWLFAPSKFVQRVISERFGVEAILLRPPHERGERETVSRGPRAGVLFVNPVVEKGVQLAVKLAARMLDHNFTFVEGWRRMDATGVEPTSNVTVLPRRTSLDALYSRVQLLIVPSLVEDASPRVILEAGHCGLPVIASGVGGIPEYVQDDCSLIPAGAGENVWESRARRLLESPDAWKRASRGQRALARELTPDVVSALAEAGLPRAAAG